MSLGRDEGERIEGSRMIAVRPESLHRSRNGARLHAHVETDALIIALSLSKTVADPAGFLVVAGLPQIPGDQDNGAL
jgi:hypothetical protein